MKKSSIIFFAPLKNKIPSSKIGGAEMGCLKTLGIYESAGIDVKILSKPSKTAGILSYLLGMLLVPLKLFCILISNKKSVIHIVGFYRNVVLIEWLIMSLSHIMNHDVIYEVRNGSMVDSYKNGSTLYKKLLKDLLLKPKVVLCQGMEYVDFIRHKWGIERTYYPNFLQDAYIPTHYRERTDKKIQLVYFGRVTESKNVLLMVDVLSILREKKLDAELTIIGASNDAYQNKINQKIIELGLTQHVTMPGRKNIKEIVEYLKNSHYFIFPSNEAQEGHSNSLTEAMGLGVVPIASKKGFNESICGDSSLIINSFDIKQYAQRILDIEQSGEWCKYSKFVQERVKDNFTQTIVSEQLITVVSKALK